MQVNIKSVQSTIATITLSKEEQDRLVIILRDYVRENKTVHTYRTVVDFAQRLGFALAPYMEAFEQGDPDVKGQEVPDPTRLPL